MDDDKTVSRPVALVVDDEALVRILTCEHLTDAGYDCRPAASAAEALALLERTPEAAVLVTDVRMPGGMDGVALAQAAAVRWPSLRIVVLSGGPPEPGARLPAGAKFIAKPYTHEALVAALTATP